MSNLAKITQNHTPSILSVKITTDKITAVLDDGREISIPTNWFSSLRDAKIEQLSHYQIAPSGYGIHWPELNEDLSIQVFLNPSRPSVSY